MTETKLYLSTMDAIARRRSIRNYQPVRLSKATLETLMSAAVLAPTALHEEQWSFVVVQGATRLKRLSELARQAFASAPAEIPPLPQGSDSADFNLFYNAENLVLICAAPMGPFVKADCWLAAENLMLAACAMGLGSCVIGSAVAGLNTPEAKAELGLPEEISVVVPIIVGEPSEASTHEQHPRRRPPHIHGWLADPLS
jgi:nitroreductase